MLLDTVGCRYQYRSLDQVSRYNKFKLQAQIESSDR